MKEKETLIKILFSLTQLKQNTETKINSIKKEKKIIQVMMIHVMKEKKQIEKMKKKLKMMKKKIKILFI